MLLLMDFMYMYVKTACNYLSLDYTKSNVN